MAQAPIKSTDTPDHGGNLDAACKVHGGAREDWIDLSTGINPVSYPLPRVSPAAWTQLPDARALSGLCDAARTFWSVPDAFDIIPTHGASATIAALPHVLNGTRASIEGPTYNEHERSFAAAGWDTSAIARADSVRVLVHPNNPDGRLWSQADLTDQPIIIDESFADCRSEYSLLPFLDPNKHILLKSFGKFWGLAGLRLGFVIAGPDIARRLRQLLGPWAVSGPALDIGALALRDTEWARATRTRLAEDAQHLDALAVRRGFSVMGGTTLFRLYSCADARAAQDALAQHKVWTRVFPYSDTWIRLGLPAPEHWPRVEAALNA